MTTDKHQILLETAERLFYTEGFHATGIDRVVSEAGVARMTLYNHFASKEALIEAVLEYRYRRYLDDLREVLAHAGPGEATEALVERHAAWLSTVSTHGCIVLRAIGEYECHCTPIAELGRRLKGEWLELIREALRSDGHSADRDAGERLLFALEGADALVPVLGADAVSAQLRRMVPAILQPTSGEAS